MGSVKTPLFLILRRYMITLKETQTNTITFQKETDTPLVTSSYEETKVYNVIIYPTMANDTGSASITYTTSSSEENPRWTTLGFNISSTSSYDGNTVAAYGGTTYNLEVWYGEPVTGSVLTWGTTESTWINTTQLWSFGGTNDINYNTVTQNSELKYKDRLFVSGSTTPTETKYISSNENATYTVYQG
jgi:hypothetical protein